MATTLIDQFEVMYSSNKFVPRIWLKSANKFIGQLIFMPNGTNLPADVKTSDGSVNLYYHLDDFENAQELLETEKTVYLLFNGTGPGNENGILTAAEPVGAGIEIKTAAATA
jgi:hypothetical protein